MSAVQRQDKDAFASLMARHLDSLYGYALRLTQEPSNAEDLVQETWLRVWANAKKYKQGTVAFSTWLHRVLHNLFVDQHRRQQRSVPEDTEVVRRDDVYDLYAQRQTKSQVDKLLWQLPDNQRAALLLFHQQGFSTREVAAILGLGERAAESLLARARRAFRQSYTEQIDDKE